MRQIVLDTETTGLRFDEGHRIIEIGCIELINRKFTGNKYHQYINPQRVIDEEAIQVHGISNHFLSDKPLFKDIAQDFIEFIQGAELIIHNAAFDIGFIEHELRLAASSFQPKTSCRVTDTLLLARQLHMGQRNSLDALCKRYGIDNSQRDLHGALLDAHLLAQVYLALTGGQGSLFDEIATTEHVSQKNNSSMIVSISLKNLVVLAPTEGETTAHENFLKYLTEKGKCAEWG